jgi:hypothetical protein
MTSQIRRRLIAALAVVTLAGCATTSTYDASYLAAARRPAATQADGRVLIVTTSQDDAYTYTGSPTSAFASATTLSISLGSIAKECAVAAFADAFKGGAEAAIAVKDPARYVVIVAPKLLSYSYTYNQLKYAGVAITPTALVNVDVRLLDAKGATRWQRSYASGPVEGPAYMFSTSPGEEISKVTHKALYDLFSKAAVEVIREALTVPAGAPAG